MEIGVCTAVASEFEEWRGYLRSMEGWGVELVEVYDAPKHMPDDKAGVVLLRKLLETRGVNPISVHAPMGTDWDVSSPDKECRESDVRRNLNSLEKSASLGAKLMVYHPCRNAIEDEKERPEREKWAKDSLARAAQRAESLGVKLAVENLLPGRLGSSPEALEQLVGDFWGETVGICLDTGHMHVCGFDLDSFDSCRGKIISVHVHDNDGTDDQHLFPGEGKIDWPAFGQKLLEIDYSGALMLECRLTDGSNVVDQLRGMLGV